MRFQDPKLEKRGDRRPYWLIRPYLPTIGPTGEIIRERKVVRLGFVDEFSASEAKKRKQAIMATINGGPIVLQSQVPFSLMLDRFEEKALPALRANTQGKYASHIKNHIRPRFGKKMMCEIEKQDIEAWLIGLKSTLAKSTRDDLRNIMSAIFKKAADWKLWSGDNPAQGAETGGGGVVYEHTLLEDADLVRFLSKLEDTRVATAATARLIVLTAITAGLRVSEILGLQWQDIKAKKQQIEVRRRWARGDMAETKTPASRRTREVGELAEWLLVTRPDEAQMDGFVFRRPDGEPLDDRDLQQHVWRPAAERAKIYTAGFGIHAFRRTSITWRQEEGATPVEAMRQAGHTRLETTLLYTLESSKREAVVAGRLLDRITGKAGGTVQ